MLSVSTATYPTHSQHTIPPNIPHNIITQQSSMDNNAEILITQANKQHLTQLKSEHLMINLLLLQVKQNCSLLQTYYSPRMQSIL